MNAIFEGSKILFEAAYKVCSEAGFADGEIFYENDKTQPEGLDKFVIINNERSSNVIAYRKTPFMYPMVRYTGRLVINVYTPAKELTDEADKYAGLIADAFYLNNNLASIFVTGSGVISSVAQETGGTHYLTQVIVDYDYKKLHINKE